MVMLRNSDLEDHAVFEKILSYSMPACPLTTHFAL